MARTVLFVLLLVLQAALSVFATAAPQRIKTQADINKLLNDDQISMGRLIVLKRDSRGKSIIVGCVGEDGSLAKLDSLACDAFVHRVLPTPEGVVLLSNTMPPNLCGIVNERLACNKFVASQGGMTPYVGAIAFLEARFNAAVQSGPFTFRGLPDAWGIDALPRMDYGTFIFPQLGFDRRAVSDLFIFWVPAPVARATRKTRRPLG